MQREREREEWKVCLIVIKKKERGFYLQIYFQTKTDVVSLVLISPFTLSYIYLFIYIVSVF